MSAAITFEEYRRRIKTRPQKQIVQEKPRDTKSDDAEQLYIIHMEALHGPNWKRFSSNYTLDKEQSPNEEE